MPAKVLNGKKIAASIRREIADEIAARTQRPPCLMAILVGDDPASQVYVRNKERAAEAAGMASRVVRLPANTTQEDLAATIADANADPEVDGILVQLPLPRHLDERSLLDLIHPDKDVDGFTTANVGRLWLGEPGHTPATPTGIMELLARSDIDVQGMDAVVVGRSTIVGKPMAALLLAANASVTVVHSRTRDLAATCRRADLVVAAVGSPALLGADHIKPGAVVVDVGINRVTDRAAVERLYPGNAKRLTAFERNGSILVGDVDYEVAAHIADAITPVPGGVGPLTIAVLLKNTLKAADLLAAGMLERVPAN